MREGGEEKDVGKEGIGRRRGQEEAIRKYERGSLCAVGSRQCPINSSTNTIKLCKFIYKI